MQKWHNRIGDMLTYVNDILHPLIGVSGLWEMLTGRVPFRGAPGEVMHQHQHAPLPLEQLKDVPQPLVVLRTHDFAFAFRVSPRLLLSRTTEQQPNLE
jgi:hypothetical protein